MKYLIILVLLIFTSCQKKVEVYNGAEIKEEWNPGINHEDTTGFNKCDPKGFYVPFRELGFENTTYEELCKRYGEPESSDKGLLINGQSADELDYKEDGKPREHTCAMLYDYVDPVIADSLFKDKECPIYNFVWRAGDSPDRMYLMYLRLYFAGEGENCRPIWGYKGLHSDVYSEE